MDSWGFEKFEEALNKAKKNESKISLEEDDILTRKAKFNEAQWSFEDGSYDDRLTRFFSFKNLIKKPETFTFFWATVSPFSQWHKCQFEANFQIVDTPKFPSDNSKYIFSSSEKYMMYSKGMLFLDREIAAKILGCDNPRELKELGKKVRCFEEIVWDFNKVEIVYEGNKAKFTQNEELKKALFATKGTTLVEAAPNDAIWGIGLAEDDPRALKRETWLGKNLLGEILTQIRTELMGEY